jgi:hypothetical protein
MVDALDMVVLPKPLLGSSGAVLAAEAVMGAHV